MNQFTRNEAKSLRVTNIAITKSNDYMGSNREKITNLWHKIILYFGCTNISFVDYTYSTDM